MILVVGGTGFIGKNLLKTICDRGRDVMTVSRRPDAEFIRNHVPTCSAMTMEQLYAAPGCLAKVSTIVWLGGGSGPTQNLDRPWREMNETVEPLLHLIYTALTHSSDTHLVYLSSGGTVYGNADDELVREDTPLRPISPYGFGKAMSEKAIGILAATQGLRATVLRPSNPVGPFQSGEKQGVIGAVLTAISTGRAFSLIGDGEAVRDYFDVRDLTLAIMAVIDEPERSVGRTYNVGSSCGRTTNQVLDMLSAITGKELLIDRKPARAVDVSRIVLDTTRISTDLEWHPTIAFEDSIREMIRSRMALGG